MALNTRLGAESSQLILSLDRTIYNIFQKMKSYRWKLLELKPTLRMGL